MTPFLRGFTAMIAIIELTGAAPLLLNGNGKVNRFVSGVGVISLGMYTGHLFLLGHIKDWLTNVYPDANTWVAVFIISLLCFALSYMLVRVLGRNRLTSMVLLGKIKK